MEIIKRVTLIISSYFFISACVVFTSGKEKQHSFRDSSDTPVILIKNGKKLWQEQGCVVCHSVYGLGGHIGPDLTNVSRRKNPAYIQHIIENGYLKMPTYALTESEIKSLLSYFDYLDQLGKYPLNSVSKEVFGSHI